MIGEIEKRTRGGKLLPLEKQRDTRREQQIRGHRSPAPGARELVAAPAAGGMGDLVVVLQIDDTSGARQVECRRAAAASILALKQEPVLGERDKFAGPT